MKTYPDELESSITNANYYLPGDLAVLLVEVELGMANLYELVNSGDIIPNAPCVVTGYPCKPDDFN
jgi:hypothetical protein